MKELITFNAINVLALSTIGLIETTLSILVMISVFSYNMYKLYKEVGKDK